MPRSLVPSTCASEVLATGSSATGSWQGPLESGYGWHLLFIDSLTPSRAPDFEAVETDVKNEWIEAQRADVRKRAYELWLGSGMVEGRHVDFWVAAETELARQHAQATADVATDAAKAKSKARSKARPGKRRK